MLSQRLKNSLRSRADWHGGPLKRRLAAAKYLWRSLRQRPRHEAWLDFLAETPPMPAIIARDPRLLERYQHRYISLGFGAATRLAIIRSHYDLVTRSWPAALLHAVYVERRAEIGQLALRDGTSLHLVLKAPQIKGLEGELGLYLTDAQGMTLSSMIVTLADQGRHLLIGCIQGAHASAGKDAVRQLTRQSHGLRPKNLLLSLAYALADTCQAERISAIDQNAHPFAGKTDKIKSDYNGFWLEAGGVPAEHGLFELPRHEPVRDAAEVESKHRSAFRRREALREAAADLLRQALTDTSVSPTMATMTQQAA